VVFILEAIHMKGFTHAAIAAAMVMAAGLLPSSGAHGQSRASVFSRFDIDSGSRIGVTVQDVEDADSKDAQRPKAGVVIETVDPGGPADKAGIKAGDTLTDFDGEHVRSVRQFSRLVQETPSGRTVAAALSRAGQRVTVNVTTDRLGRGDDFTYHLLESVRPATPAPPAPPAPPAARLAPMPFDMVRVYGRRLGIALETLDEQLAQYFGVKDGVLVKAVAADSVAQKAGIKAGDVITSVNGRQVYEVSDVNRAIDRTDDGGDFTVDVMRDKKTLTLKGKFESRGRGRSSMF